MDEPARASPAALVQPVQSALSVPRRLLARSVVLTDQGLMNGVRVVGGPGAGKSRWAGRVLVWQKLIRGHPIIVIDPTGGVVANVFDKLCRMPKSIQEMIWPRIRYVDMAARDYVMPMPLYARRRPDDTLSAVANRFLEVIRRADPHMATASVEGLNASLEVGSAAGMMAAALGLQVTEVADMIEHPKRWQTPFRAALAAYPHELQRAYDYFQELQQIKNPAIRRRYVGSFRNKLIPFLDDPSLKAMFAAGSPGIDLSHEMEQGHLVIYDLQGETNSSLRRLKLLWIFLYIVEYVRIRGDAGRENPILLVIDEIASLLGERTMEHSIMAADINDLVTNLSRNFAINVCLMHQNLSSIDPYTQVSLGQLGTQVIGWVQEPQDCLKLAEQFFRYRPDMVRKTETQPVWMNVQRGFGPFSYSEPEVIDTITTTTEHTVEEQMYLLADRFRTLGRFHFLVRPASGEGTLSRHLYPMSIESLDPGCYPDHKQVAEVRCRLRKRDGIPVSTLLAQIEKRQQGAVQLPQKRKTDRAILSEDQGESTVDAPKSSPVPKPKPTADDFWEEVS